MLRAFAEKCLWVWGDQMRARIAKASERAMYDGNIDSLAYRPEDDPHPNAFIVCMVDSALENAVQQVWAYAGHVYVHKRPPSAFGLSDWNARKVRGELIERVSAVAGERMHETLASIHAEEILREIRSRRQRA